MDCSTPDFPVLHCLRSLLKLLSIESVMPSNHLILCHPLLLPPSVFPNIRVFSNESSLYIRWPKYWDFSFKIGPSNDYSGLIPFRIDWFDLTVQGILNSLLLNHRSKASILKRSAFFIVQLSNPYMTTGKTIALTRRTFVGKVMSLLFNMLSRFVIAFLPRRKSLLISWLVTGYSDFGAQENKFCHCFHCFPIYLPWNDGSRCMIFIFWMLSFEAAFSLSSFTFIKRLLSSLCFLLLEWYHLHIWGYWHFSQESWFQLVILPAQDFSWCTLHIR